MVSNLQLVESLCYIVERQAALIRNLATELEQERNLSDAEKIAVDCLDAECAAIIGTDESPDIS